MGYGSGWASGRRCGSCWLPAPRARSWIFAIVTSWSGLGWQGGGEEVDEQRVDALGLVVVDPVRGVGQPLDALEVGHVLVVGFGQVFAEVAIALRSHRLERAGMALPLVKPPALVFGEL